MIEQNTRYALRLVPERCLIAELKAGDLFILRNDDGSLVDPGDGVCVATQDGQPHESGGLVECLRWELAVEQDRLPK